MNYKAIYFSIERNTEENRQILIALLDKFGFDGFIETDEEITAYTTKTNLNLSSDVRSYLEELNVFGKIETKEEFILEKNWNELWESDYKPAIINNQCIVRAPFHKIERKYKYEILIEPRMSFGTGHHETTALMIDMMLQTDCKDKTILDMGCGTGVLGIMASKMGAESILFVDINEWAYENTIVNAAKNNITGYKVIKGDINTVENKKFDIIFSNITRNVLLQHTKYYTNCLNNTGYLFISGFIINDKYLLIKEFNKYPLKFVHYLEKNNWSALKFQKY